MIDELEAKAKARTTPESVAEYGEIYMRGIKASDIIKMISVIKAAQSISRVLSDQGDLSPSAMKLYQALRDLRSH